MVCRFRVKTLGNPSSDRTTSLLLVATSLPVGPRSSVSLVVHTSSTSHSRTNSTTTRPITSLIASHSRTSTNSRLSTTKSEWHVVWILLQRSQTQVRHKLLLPNLTHPNSALTESLVPLHTSSTARSGPHLVSAVSTLMETKPLDSSLWLWRSSLVFRSRLTSGVGSIMTLLSCPEILGSTTHHPTPTRN